MCICVCVCVLASCGGYSNRKAYFRKDVRRKFLIPSGTETVVTDSDRPFSSRPHVHFCTCSFLRICTSICLETISEYVTIYLSRFFKSRRSNEKRIKNTFSHG